MKHLLFMSTLFSFLIACTKGGGNVYLKGRVYNPVTNEGVSNVTIELVKDKPLSGDPINGGSVKVVKSVISDENGNIELSHTTDLTNKYFYRYSMNGQLLKEIGWDSGVPTNGKEVKRGSNDYDNLKVLPYGNLKFKISNIDCQSEFDTIKIKQTHSHDPKYTWGQEWVHSGCIQYEGSYDLVTIGTLTYDYVVIKNGSSSNYSFTDTLSENEDKTIIIEY